MGKQYGTSFRTNNYEGIRPYAMDIKVCGIFMKDGNNLQLDFKYGNKRFKNIEQVGNYITDFYKDNTFDVMISNYNLDDKEFSVLENLVLDNINKKDVDK